VVSHERAQRPSPASQRIVFGAQAQIGTRLKKPAYSGVL
jgi:hypothetical protein